MELVSVFQSRTHMNANPRISKIDEIQDDSAEKSISDLPNTRPVGVSQRWTDPDPRSRSAETEEDLGNVAD